MRKRLVGILICILCMLVCMPSALAEEVRVTVTTTQTEMADSGNVKFTFNISNFSDYELSDIVIVYNGTSHTELQQTIVPPNQSIQNYELELPVSESQLGNPILFTITGVRNGETISAEASVTIMRSSDPVITLTCVADATTVRQGESVKLTYTIKNETKFDMTDIQVVDQEISDMPQKLQLLRAGGTMSWDWSLKMGEDDVLSAPTATYTVNGKTKSYSGVEPQTLTSLLVRLSMQVSAGVPTSAGVNFTLDVKNTGNQEVKDITITDERNNAVNSEPFSLKPEETVTHSFLVVPVMTEASREVQFTLKGTDALAQAYTLTTPESYPVYPFVDESQISVTLKTETVTPWTSDTGKVVARVLITNHSAVALTNISVLETGNVLKTYDSLQAGETTFDTEIILGSPRNLQFTLKGNDPTGATRELAASQLPVAYGTEQAEATSAPEQIKTGNNMQAFSFLSSTISKILVALGILMVLSFVVLIALSIAERNRMGGVRFDDDDGEDDLDDFFRETDTDDRSYFDDREEVSNYTARIQNTSARRTAETRLPPKQLPPPVPDHPPRVSVEYDAPPAAPARDERQDAPASYWQPAATGPQPTVHIASPQLQEAPVYPDAQHGNAQYGAQMYAAPQYAASPYVVPPQTAFIQEPRPMQYATPQPAYDPQSQPATWVAPQNAPAQESTYAPYAYADADVPCDTGALQPPKVLVNKRAPAVQPQRRNEIRHVHKEPQK